MGEGRGGAGEPGKGAVGAGFGEPTRRGVFAPWPVSRESSYHP